MKKFLIAILIISPSLMGNEVVPEKLLIASKAFSKDSSLYPIHKIDLIIFLHKDIEERDKEESFPELYDLTYSNDLIKLSESPSFLVDNQSIKEGLVPNKQVIKSIKFRNKEEENLETEETKSENLTISKPFLPYEYFVLLDDKGFPIKKLARKLDLNKEYEVIFHGSWYQPLFNKEFASPIYIQADNSLNSVHGELLLYKERFLHSEIRMRLAEKSDKKGNNTSIILYNFNNLLKITKVENKFINFFKSIGEEVSSFSNWIFRSREFTPMISNEENNLVERETYKDKFEINQKTKMKYSEYHYIDHPYLGIVLRVSLWERDKE